MNSKLEKYFNFHDNQFGFVKNGGCNKTIFTVRSCFEDFTVVVMFILPAWMLLRL